MAREWLRADASPGSSTIWKSTILVTGGAGFIGSNFILQRMQRDSASIVNLDKLTYAGNLHNLETVAGERRYEFVHGDIADRSLVRGLLERRKPRRIVHFAAESHVDRSIRGPEDFIRTNVDGTFALLEEVRTLLGRSGRARKGGFPLSACFDRRSVWLAGAGGPSLF